MGELANLDIRYSEPDDVRILYDAFSDKEICQWFPWSSEKEIHLAVKNWSGLFRFRASITATIENVPCGIGTLFLMPYKKVSHHSMFYIVVDKKYQRKGVGSTLLKNVLHLAQNYFRLESIDCEVFEGCPIIPLLQKFSFEEYAYQKGYIKTQNGYLPRILLEHFFKETK